MIEDATLAASWGEVTVAEGGGTAEVSRAAAARRCRRHILGDGARGRRVFAAASSGGAKDDDDDGNTRKRSVHHPHASNVSDEHDLASLGAHSCEEIAGAAHLIMSNATEGTFFDLVSRYPHEEGEVAQFLIPCEEQFNPAVMSL